MQKILSIVPLTVIAAIVLFLIKEFAEGVRRYRADQRKRIALRTLLARECELNNWTIKSIKHIVETIRDESEENSLIEFSFIFPKSGKPQFRVKHPDSEFKNGSGLGSIHRDIMSKNLLDVATLDKELFSALQPAYDSIANLEHLRESLIYYVDPEDDQDKMHLEGFIHYALNELEDVKKDLSNLYMECTGQALNTHRVR